MYNKGEMAHFNYIPGVYNPPISHYSELVVPDYVNVGILIGKDGKNFKYITCQSKCQYIWYDKERRVIELWGPMWALESAKNTLRGRFEQFKPDLTLEQFEELIKTTSTYTRENGDVVKEFEGPEWAIQDYCCLKNLRVEESHMINRQTFWAKVIC